MLSLRYLSLSCSFLKRLPESLTYLINLQTLKLRDSDFLHELPKGLKYMKNLYYLDIEKWLFLVCTPPGLGELLCLQKLSIFIVSRDPGHEIRQLRDLNLEGELSILGLGCIRDFEDATSANLATKKNLTSLTLSWLKGTQDDSAEHCEEVLEGLQPSQNLEELRVEWYRGSKFPTWMLALSFDNLSKIILEECHECECLPPLGSLPCLVKLSLNKMDSIKRLGGEWHGNEERSSFPALKTLSILRMPNFEEWTIPNTTESFPCLEELKVERCPKLTELPFLPNLKCLILRGKDATILRSVMFLTSLTSLTLSWFNELDVSLEGGVLRNHKGEIVQPLSNLKTLEISYSYFLCSLPNWLGSLESLSQLVIMFCNNLKSFPDYFRDLKSLKVLNIFSCPLLEKNCTKPSGEDWANISHIPDIYIN